MTVAEETMDTRTIDLGALVDVLGPSAAAALDAPARALRVGGVTAD